MTMRGGFIGVLAALHIAGCALLRGAEPAPGPSPEATVESAAPRPESTREGDEIAALLAYYQELMAMPADELRREYQTVSQSATREKSELGRLRLALLMCVPGAAWRDDTKLLALLDGVIGRAAAESPRRQFASLLQKLAAERLREQRRGDDLQQKLDALVNIERSLRERKANKP